MQIAIDIPFLHSLFKSRLLLNSIKHLGTLRMRNFTCQSSLLLTTLDLGLDLVHKTTQILISNQDLFPDILFGHLAVSYSSHSLSSLASISKHCSCHSFLEH